MILVVPKELKTQCNVEVGDQICYGGIKGFIDKMEEVPEGLELTLRNVAGGEIIYGAMSSNK